MNVPTLHIVFSDNAARVLQRALNESGRSDRVIWFPDDLAAGPIDPPDAATREEWVRCEIGSVYVKWDWPIDRAERFWRSALSTRRRRVVWVSRHAVSDYTGFLEFSRRAGDSFYEVADIGDAATRRGSGGDKRRSPPIDLSDLYNEPATVLGLLAAAKPSAPAQRDADQAIWERLRAENAALRVLTERGLASAHADHFDDLLLSCVVPHWRKVARILSDARAESAKSGFCQVREVVLCARIRALATAGRVESQGDLLLPRYSEIRLPGAGTGGAAAAPAQLASSSVSQ